MLQILPHRILITKAISWFPNPPNGSRANNNIIYCCWATFYYIRDSKFSTNYMRKKWVTTSVKSSYSSVSFSFGPRRPWCNPVQPRSCWHSWALLNRPSKSDWTFRVSPLICLFDRTGRPAFGLAFFFWSSSATRNSRNLTKILATDKKISKKRQINRFFFDKTDK